MRGSSNLYFSHVYFGFDIWFPLTSNVGDQLLKLKCTYFGLFGPHALWGSWLVTLNAGQAPVPLTVFHSGLGFDRGLGCFGLGYARPIVERFWYVATVTPSWPVRNFVVISGVHLEPDRGRFWSSFGFGRSIVGGTGARAVKSAHLRKSSWPKYLLIFYFVLNLCCSLVVLCQVMLAINCTYCTNWFDMNLCPPMPTNSKYMQM